MKKIFLAILLAYFVISGSAFAQNEIPLPTGELNPGPSQVPSSVSYTLPYPGILPGEPLYPLKAARDRIIDFFITDPLKKSNYYLLQADKRLASAIALFDQGNQELGESTLSKGQNYLEKSLDKALEAEKRQLEISEVLGKIKLSSQKHREEISNLSKKVQGETKKKLEADLKRAQEFEKEALTIEP